MNSGPGLTRADRAEECFRSGFSCSQAVLSVCSEELGLERETAFRVSCGFGAGAGRTGNMCGAVTGAILVIGLKYGRSDVKDIPARDTTYSLVQRFIREFEAKHGSVSCTDLIGFDLGIPEEYEQARKEGLFTIRCPVLTKEAVGILERIL